MLDHFRRSSQTSYRGSAQAITTPPPHKPFPKITTTSPTICRSKYPKVLIEENRRATVLILTPIPPCQHSRHFVSWRDRRTTPRPLTRQTILSVPLPGAQTLLPAIRQGGLHMEMAQSRATGKPTAFALSTRVSSPDTPKGKW